MRLKPPIFRGGFLVNEIDVDYDERAVYFYSS